MPMRHLGVHLHQGGHVVIPSNKHWAACIGSVHGERIGSMASVQLLRNMVSGFCLATKCAVSERCLRRWPHSSALMQKKHPYAPYEGAYLSTHPPARWAACKKPQSNPKPSPALALHFHQKYTQQLWLRSKNWFFEGQEEQSDQ